MNVSPINYQPKLRIDDGNVNFKSKGMMTKPVEETGKRTFRVLAASILASLGVTKFAKTANKKVEIQEPIPADTKNEESVVDVKPEIKPTPKLVQKSSEEILNERVETWEELFAKAEELKQVRKMELDKLGKKTHMIYGNDYYHANYIKDVKGKKTGKIADSSIPVGLGIKLLLRYADKFNKIEKMNWKDCWDIPWNLLTERQKYDFAKYAYKSGRIPTSHKSEFLGEVDYYEKDFGKQTCEVPAGTPGADHICYSKYKHTYELNGYGIMIECKTTDADYAPYSWSYEGKDPRPACRVLWDMQQNGTADKKPSWPIGK